MRLPLPKRISSENVNPESQPAVDAVAGIVNNFMEDVTSIINGNIDFDNLVFKVLRVEMIVDNQGKPKTSPELNTGVLRHINGLLCVNVEDGINPNIIPDVTAVPTILSNTLGNGRVKINKVLNLKENRKYILTLLVL